MPLFVFCWRLPDPAISVLPLIVLLDTEPVPVYSLCLLTLFDYYGGDSVFSLIDVCIHDVVFCC